MLLDKQALVGLFALVSQERGEGRSEVGVNLGGQGKGEYVVTNFISYRIFMREEFRKNNHTASPPPSRVLVAQLFT